jgi:hypothetical protein
MEVMGLLSPDGFEVLREFRNEWIRKAPPIWVGDFVYFETQGAYCRDCSPDQKYHDANVLDVRSKMELPLELRLEMWEPIHDTEWILAYAKEGTYLIRTVRTDP